MNSNSALKSQILLRVPDATDLTALDPRLQELLARLGLELPAGHTMPGTRVFDGKRLIHAQFAASYELTSMLLDDLGTALGLAWELLAAQSWDGSQVYVPVPLAIVDWLDDLYTTDDPPQAYRPTAPCALHSWSGAAPWVWETTP
jgi:hypothetical protein